MKQPKLMSRNGPAIDDKLMGPPTQNLKRIYVGQQFAYSRPHRLPSVQGFPFAMEFVATVGAQHPA